MNRLEPAHSSKSKDEKINFKDAESYLAKFLSIYSVAKFFKNYIDKRNVSENGKISIVRMFLVNKTDKNKPTVLECF